jgi:hypothetical protein
MAFINRLLLIGLLSSGIGAATTAQAGNQLFEGSWTVKAQGNECSDAVDPTPGPHCGGGASESEIYGAFGIPLQIQCNPYQPRCAWSETPTDGAGVFAPLGGRQTYALYCAPWVNWQGNGTSARPAKGETAISTGMAGVKFPPLYRNPAFFTAGGQPGTTLCTSNTRSSLGGKGLAQAGQPIVGKWGAVTTGTPGIGGFTFAAAPNNHAAGVRIGQGDFGYLAYYHTYPGHWKLTQGTARSGAVGEFAAIYPYVYSYTYATLRNNAGIFGPGKGPGDFSVKNYQGTNTVARAKVKQGAAKFGGTMRMLGALSTKVCYYRNGGCSVISFNWRYEAIGATAHTSGGIVTRGYLATYTVYQKGPTSHFYSILELEGSRFPWTTGSVTVTAVGRGPHKTIHYAKGYDNRTPTSGKGTIQMVSPVLTRWLQPAVNFETGGVAILRIKFVPEPHTWAMLVVGASLLCMGTRMRKR